MLRNIIKTLPAFALALPIITATPSASAGGGEQSQSQGQTQQGQKPALPSQEGQGQGQTGQTGQKPTLPKPEQGGGEVSIEFAQAFCVMAEVLAENRACEVVDTDKGIARCAVRGGEQVSPPAQTKPEQEPEEGGVLYVGIEACTALGVDINIKK